MPNSTILTQKEKDDLLHIIDQYSNEDLALKNTFGLIPPKNAGDEVFLWDQLFNLIKKGFRESLIKFEEINEFKKVFYSLPREEKIKYLDNLDKIFEDKIEHAEEIMDLYENMELTDEIEDFCKKYPPQVKPFVELLVYSYLSGTPISQNDWEAAQTALSPEGMEYFTALNLGDTFEQIQRNPLDTRKYNKPLNIENLAELIDGNRRNLNDIPTAEYGVPIANVVASPFAKNHRNAPNQNQAYQPTPTPVFNPNNQRMAPNQNNAPQSQNFQQNSQNYPPANNFNNQYNSNQPTQPYPNQSQNQSPRQSEPFSNTQQARPNNTNTINGQNFAPTNQTFNRSPKGLDDLLK